MNADPTPLRATQELFWRVIVWPRGVEHFLEHASPQDQKLFESTFAQTPEFSRVERLRVYAQAYFWRLFEVLADQFPITAWLLGRERFHNLVTDFVLDEPSESPDIRRFGARFPDFVSTHTVEQLTPGLGGLAAVERAIVAAVDLADEPRLGAPDLQRIAPEQWPQTRFAVTQTAAFICCALPFAELRSAHESGHEAPADPADPAGLAGPAGGGALDATVEATGPVLVWRQADHDVYQRRLGAAEGRALQILSQGGTFADACDAAAGPTCRDASATDVVGWLQRWLRDDVLVSIS